MGHLKHQLPFLIAIILLVRFAYRVIQVSLSFPNLFPADTLFLAGSLFPAFIGIVTLLVAVWFALSRLPQSDHSPISRFKAQLNENWRGLLLAVVFFVVYFVLANVFNRQDFNTNNVFFAADTHQWKLRIASVEGYSMEMRAIHPLAFFIIRPVVFAISLLSGADLFQAALFLLALTGCTGVFLLWLFIKRAVADENYAFLFAALFGLGTAQLMFNTVTETYIFSAFLLLLFFVLLQKRVSFWWLVLTGIGVFGVTISNLLQATIGVFFADLKVKRAIVFTMAVLAISAGLNLIHSEIYPSSALYFSAPEPGNEFRSYLNTAIKSGWAWRGRLVASDMFLYSVVASQPFYQVYHREDRSQFPKFNFMQGDRLSPFVGTGKIAVWTWLGIIAASLFVFSHSLLRERLSQANRFTLAFLECLAFNFIFHLIYGFEPFLYAADWTFALFLFAALALRPLAKNTWLQIALVVMLGLLTLNNLSFLHFLMNGISPFIPVQ